MNIDIKKKYNHHAIESELIKKIPFQEPYTTKKGTIKRDAIITQLPIKITKNTSLYDVSNIIKESVLATYWNIKGITTNLVPIFDIESKDVDLKTYQNLLIKTGIFFGIDTDNIIYSERNTHFVRNLFVELVNNGLIYEDYSINYRSIKEQKTLGNDEIERKKIKTKQYNIRYFVDTKNISLIVPTTQPETIFADVALAVHPDDKRYKKIINSKVIIPIINKTIPVIADESVNPMEGTGIVRITPAHDKKSLLIAKKYGFKIDKFAIDKNGCFTTCAGEHFCGKKAEEFTKNVIKNLDDIHNLESTKIVEIEMPFHRKTGEKVWPLLCNQLFIKIDKEKHAIHEIFENTTLQIIPQNKYEDIKSIFKTMEYWSVTKEDSKGFCLPLRKSKNGKFYFISDNEFLNIPAKKTKNKKTVLSLIIYNLVVDRRLQQHFSIEECIDVLLSKNRTGEQTTIETYVELFDEILPKGYSKEIKELKKIIEYTKKTPQTIYNEKFSLGLMEILEKSIAIISQKKGLYTLHIDTLVNDEGLTLQTEKIEETVGYGMLFMRIMETFNDTKKSQKICYLSEENIHEFIKILTINQCIQKKIPFHSCIIKNVTQPTKIHKEVYKELIKKYGIDCTRMYATNPTNDITEYQQFINKIRNASRFIIKHLHEKKSTKTISDLQQLARQIEKKADELNEFESWILYKTIELQKEYHEIMNQGMIEEALYKSIITIKKDFCDKYLEISKTYETEHSSKIMLRCMGTFLTLLYPFSPFFTQYIREILGRKNSLLQQHRYEKTPNIIKNYKTQLFMDIIDMLLTMKQKHNYAKHEQVDIGFFAPLDFFRYLKQQEKILIKLINAGSIEYLENEKHLEGYYTETIINITVGIKKQIKEKISKNQENLEEILHQKEQELQALKLLVSNLSINNANQELIKQKKKEIIKLKKEIEELQYYIQKSKLHK